MPNTSPVARSGIVPLFVHEAHAAAPIDAYFNAASPQGNREAFDRTLGDRREDAPYGSYRIAGGVALIPVLGALIPRGLFMGMGFATSYEAFGAEMRRAAADPTVSEIAVMIDSPGGYVTGIDGAANAIKAAAAIKPVTAYVQGMACSAAYWLASACGEIVCSPLSELGSIGVVQAHFDMSKMLDSIGIKITLLHAGAKKVDGNPYEPLSDRVRAEMVQELEDLRMAFAEAVAAGRSSLDVAAVLATEAATYRGEEAVKRGLADRVGFLADDLPDSDDPLVITSPTGRFMEHSMFTQAQLDAARQEGRLAGITEGRTAGLEEGRKAGVEEGRVAGLETGRKEGKAEGELAGATAERERVKAIKGCEAAKKRPKAAEHLAMTTPMGLASAEAFLAGLDEEKPAATEQTLEQEMAGAKVPAIGADGGKSLDKLQGEERGAAIAASLGFGKKTAA